MLTYIFLLIFIPTILSYLILKLIYTKLLKSKKKVSKFLVFLGSIGLMIFYYTPYSFYLEPSYWQFRNMCKINELLNDEYKYNKILSYFDTDLESLDWEELNEKTWKIKESNGNYKKGIYEYATLTKKKQLNYRTSITASFLSNESKINHYNINQMSIGATWHTNRFYLSGDFYWNEATLSCIDVAKKNYEPKGANNE
ncbi:hypothetical protein GY404_001898 [Campylobacter coli]|nr:hypothetical protein [Campylobacter coli]